MRASTLTNIARTLSALGSCPLGLGVSRPFVGDWRTAAICWLVAAILFAIAYHVQNFRFVAELRELRETVSAR